MGKKNVPSVNGDNGPYVPALAEANGDYYNVNTSAEKIHRRDWLIRLIAIILLVLLLLLGISYCAMTILNNAGRFTVSLTPNEYGVQLSSSPDFDDPTLNLYAAPIEKMDNITKDWILNQNDELGDDKKYDSFKDIDLVWGEHNGTNYLAYTFAVKNASKDEDDTVDYNVKVNLLYAYDGADEALRVMVFRNGKATTYAKAPVKYISGKKQTNAATGAYIRDKGIDVLADKSFVSDDVIMSETVKNFEVGQTHRYTIVVWLEGEDPECVNDIMGGEAKLSMDIEVLGSSSDSEAA